MSFTINSAKELSVSPRPVCFVDVVFPDATTAFYSTIAVTFDGNAYEARIDDQQMERLAALSEQGIDRVPSVTISLADPSASVFASTERGHGWKGAKLTIRLALYDMQAGTFSTDNFVPFVGQCDQPSTDDEKLTVTAVSILNLSRFMLPTVPIEARCPWINPVTTDQRADVTARGDDSPYSLCGETRDLTTAPPCQNSKQTCTQPLSYGGSTWEPKQSDSGRNYLSGGKWSWINADTSGKYKEFWPTWLGGKAWVTCIALNQWGDGNYTRGEAAVGFGPVNIERVIVNGVELSRGGKDYFWEYSNDGSHAGAVNTDAEPDGGTALGDPFGNKKGDPHGNLTVVEYRAPKNVIAPESPAKIQVLGEKLLGGSPSSLSSISITSAAASDGPIVIQFGRILGGSDPGDGAPITITGSSWADVNGTFVMRLLDLPYDHATLQGTYGNGSGGGATLYYNKPNQSGGAPTPSLIAEGLKWCGIPLGGINSGDFAAASSICNATITYTDGSGNTQTQARFASAVAVRQRRSVAEIIRGLRQSIAAYLSIGGDGLVSIRMEGPLAEQQPSSPDGSNDVTGISSTLRDGSTDTGYFAYKFDESNSTGLKSSGRPVAESPNRVTYSFQDPAQGYAISTFSLVEPDDVARIGYEVPGGLQVNPEGIASYNFGFRCGKLGLAKIHRGNPVSDTRGTDWWEWQASFRACKLRIGDIVSITSAKYALADQAVRLTEIRPSKNYETVTLKGHAHDDQWYLDSHGDTPDAGYSSAPTNGLGVTVPPTFAVEASALDSAVAEVTGLTFSNPVNTYSITSGAWTFYSVAEAAPQTTLSATCIDTDTTMDVADATGIVEGDYIQLIEEVVRVNAPPSGNTLSIDRQQLGSASDASVSSGASVWLVAVVAKTVAFPLDFVNSADIETWKLEQPLPDQKLLSVGGTVTNAFGTSPVAWVCFTSNGTNGLQLPSAGGAGASGYTVINVTNVDTALVAHTPGQIVSVVATTQDVTITLPVEATAEGDVVTAKRAAGSTHDVFVEPAGSDTIDGSSTPVTLDGTTKIWTGIGVTGDNWVTVSADGVSGTYTPPPDAPNVTWVTSGGGAPSIAWAANGHDWNAILTATINLPTTDPDYDHLKQIAVKLAGPDSSTKTYPTTMLYADFGGGTTIAVNIDLGLIPDYAAHNWSLTAQCLNDLGIRTALVSGNTLTVTVTPPTVSSATAAETGPRSQNPDASLTTTATVTPTLSFNPAGGGGKQTVTIWTVYDWGNGAGSITTWKGWYDVTGTSSGILLSGENLLFVTTLASTTVTVRVAIGAVDKKSAIPAGAATATFTMYGPGGVSGLTSAEITCSLLAVNYFRVSGGFDWGWRGIQGTNPSNPDVWFGRFYLSRGSWNAGTQTWTYDSSYCPVEAQTGLNEWAVGDTEDDTVVTLRKNGLPVPGQTFTTVASPPMPFAAPGASSAQFMLRMVSYTRKNADTGIAQACWTGAAPAGSVYSTDQKRCIITPDATKAAIQASDFDPATLGDRLGITGGKLQVSTPLAPPPASVTVPVVRATSGSGTVLAAILGFPVWNADLTITLSTGLANYPHTKSLNIAIPGYSDYTVAPPSSGTSITVTLPTEYQDNVSHALVASVTAINEDGAPSAAATATINVPAAPLPTGATAPAPPSFASVTATATPYFFRFGHEWNVGFNIGFTAPASSGAYDVVVSKLYPSGARALITVMRYAPFVATTTYNFVSDAADPLIAGNWTIEFLPVNADNVTAAVKQVTVAVAANTITLVTGAEGTPFIEAGDGAKTHVNITPTITTANAPGLSAGAPQTVTFYVSADSGSTWFGLDWVDQSASGVVNTFEVWRPHLSAKTCKVACAIGAWAWPNATFNGVDATGPIADASLPSIAVRSSTFTLSVIGAPAVSGTANAQVLPRTASGTALWNGVTISKASEGIASFGLPDGLQSVNPTATADPNFWFSTFEVWVISDTTGAVAPTELGGQVNGFKGPLNDVPGATTIGGKDIDGWLFNPPNSGCTTLKIQLVFYSRSGQRTVQTSAWSGSPPNVSTSYFGSYATVRFGEAPPSTIIATLSAASVGEGLYLDPVTGKLKLGTFGDPSNMLSNGDFRDAVLGATTPVGWQVGGGQVGTINVVSSPVNSGQTRSVALSGQHSSIVQTFSCIPGRAFQLEDYVMTSSADGTMRCGLVWLASDKVSFIGITESAQQSGTFGAWVQMSINGTAPSGAGFVQVFISTNNNFNGQPWYVSAAKLALGVGSNQIVAGTLSNLTGNLYTTSARPVAVVSGLPPLPQTAYPAGSLIFLLTDGKIYRNDSNIWKATAQPSDIIAGTMAAVNIIGGTLTLDLNGATTTVNNGTDPYNSTLMGLQCKANGLQGWYSALDPAVIYLADSNGQIHAQLRRNGTPPNSWGIFTLAGYGAHFGKNISMNAGLGGPSFNLTDGTGKGVALSVGSGGASLTVYDGGNFISVTPTGIAKYVGNVFQGSYNFP